MLKLRLAQVHLLCVVFSWHELGFFCLQFTARIALFELNLYIYECWNVDIEPFFLYCPPYNYICKQQIACCYSIQLFAMINKSNGKAWIAALAIIPSIQAAFTFPTFPTIQDQIFNFPKYDLHPPRIPLKYIRGVVSCMRDVGLSKYI